jgi:hypothetical protein
MRAPHATAYPDLLDVDVWPPSVTTKRHKKRTLLKWMHATSAEKSQDGEQNNRAKQRCNKRADYPASHVQTEHPAKPTSYQCSDNSHNDVHDDAEAATVDDTTGQCASDAADNQPEDDSM